MTSSAWPPQLQRAGWPRVLPPGAPTDPDVRTLAHPVPPMLGSPFKASDVFPGPGSNIRHPLSVFPSLHRVPRDQFPGFIGTMRVLRLPAVHPTALRFLRLAVPRLHSLFSLLDGRVHRRGPELVTRYLRPGISEETTGSPKFLSILSPFSQSPTVLHLASHERRSQEWQASSRLWGSSIWME